MALAAVSLITGEVPGGVLALVELLLIVVILFQTWRAQSRRWHQRWLDYRLVAECLRVSTWTRPLGRRAVELRVPAHDSVEPISSWVAWHWKAIVRATPMVDAKINPTYLEALWSWVLEDGIGGQVRYHTSNAKTLGSVATRLKWTSRLLFGATAGLCAFHVFLGVSHRFSSSTNLVALGTVVLPALAACSHAILSQADFETLARRSKAMAETLGRVYDIAKLGPEVEGARPAWVIRAAAESAIEAMAAELVGWHTSLRAKPPEVPAG